MAMTRSHLLEPGTEPIPFAEAPAGIESSDLATADRAEEALASLESMSRRIDDLARELNCLGFFDDDDRPRAA